MELTLCCRRWLYPNFHQRLKQLDRLDTVVGLRVSIELASGADVGCIHVSTEVFDPIVVVRGSVELASGCHVVCGHVSTEGCNGWIRSNDVFRRVADGGWIRPACSDGFQVADDSWIRVADDGWTPLDNPPLMV